MQQIQATERAFAAVLAGGSVATWRDHVFGGDNATVQDQLRSVQQPQLILYRSTVTTTPFIPSFNLQVAHLLRSWQMNQSLPGVKATRSATAQQFLMNSGVLSLSPRCVCVWPQYMQAVLGEIRF